MNETLMLISKSLQYAFIQKALITGLFIAVSSSLIGVFLVLKKFSLISDGLSHVTFATVALSLVLGASPLLFSIPLVIFASLIIVKLTEKAHLYADAAIGLVSAISVATGVIIISTSKGFNSDIYSYLFGSILAITSLEVALSAAVSIIVISAIFLYFNELFLIIYDEDYAKVSKINIGLINFIFVILQSLTIVIGVKIVGAMLMSSLVIFPAVTALQIAKNFKVMILFSLLISVISVILGIFTSFVFNIPTGASIVVVNAVLFAAAFLMNKILKIK